MPAGLTVLIYKAAIRPALAYGNETWPVTETLMYKVGSCEMRMLRYCMGISLQEHRRNEEMTSEAKIMLIRDVMRKRRLECMVRSCKSP